jgi:ribonuclease HI
LIVTVTETVPTSAEVHTIDAAIDGSCLGNPGPGGCAWYVNDATFWSGHVPDTTNNRAELLALWALLRDTAHWPNPLRVVCDSQYVVKTFNEWLPAWKANGWRKANGRSIQSRDIIEAIEAAMCGRNVTLRWVPGHSGHLLQEQAHRLAEAAARWRAA